MTGEAADAERVVEGECVSAGVEGGGNRSIFEDIQVIFEDMQVNF